MSVFSRFAVKSKAIKAADTVRKSLSSIDTAPLSNRHSDRVPILRVSEVFRSLQGEGPFTGKPSIFLRLGICNLNCVWCDTAYTWLFDPKRLQEIRDRVAASSTPNLKLPSVYNKALELTREPADAVTDRVLALAGRSVRNVVITGGEPLLHKRPLQSVVRNLLDSGFTIEFETNGTISPHGLPSKVHLNVSPKLSNSIQSYEARINLPVLKQCVAFPSSILKFVVDGQEDMEEVLNIVETVGIESQRVFLMPQGAVSHFVFCSSYRNLQMVQLQTSL